MLRSELESYTQTEERDAVPVHVLEQDKCGDGGPSSVG